MAAVRRSVPIPGDLRAGHEGPCEPACGARRVSLAPMVSAIQIVAMRTGSYYVVDRVVGSRDEASRRGSMKMSPYHMVHGGPVGTVRRRNGSLFRKIIRLLGHIAWLASNRRQDGSGSLACTSNACPLSTWPSVYGSSFAPPAALCLQRRPAKPPCNGSARRFCPASDRRTSVIPTP